MRALLATRRKASLAGAAMMTSVMTLGEGKGITNNGVVSGFLLCVIGHLMRIDSLANVECFMFSVVFYAFYSACPRSP